MTSPLLDFQPTAPQTQKSEPTSHGDHQLAPAFPEDGNPVNDNTARRLKPRHIQLIGIGG